MASALDSRVRSPGPMMIPAPARVGAVSFWAADQPPNAIPAASGGASEAGAGTTPSLTASWRRA